MSNPSGHVRPEDVETQQFEWGVLKWLSTPTVTGATEFSAGIVQLVPGAGHERHTHPESEEILYVISGQGQQTVDGETFEIGPGELVFIDADTPHSTINTGWETLKLVAIYGPPGPEGVLREHPDATIHPPGTFPEH